jgi:hypothetical protein
MSSDVRPAYTKKGITPRADGRFRARRGEEIVARALREGKVVSLLGETHTHSSTLVRHATAASPFPSRFPIRTRTRRAARSSPTRFRAGSFRPGKSPSSALSSSVLLGDLRAAPPVEDVAAGEELLGDARWQTLRQDRAVASPVGTPLIGGRLGAKELVRCVRLAGAAGAVTVRRQAEDRDPAGPCAGRGEAPAGTAAESASVAPADRNCRRFRSAIDLAVRWSVGIAAAFERALRPFRRCCQGVFVASPPGRRSSRRLWACVGTRTTAGRECHLPGASRWRGCAAWRNASNVR